MCVLRAHCTSVAFRKDSRLKELSACQYINFNYKTILQKKKRTVCCTKLMNVRRQRVLVHILFCLDFCSIHLENLMRDSVANSNLLPSWSDRCAGHTFEVNVFITLLSQKLSLTTCFFCLCGGSDFHAILSGSQTNVESIFTLRWPSIKLSQPASQRLWSSSAYRIPGLPACACAGVHERSSLRQLIKIVAVCSRSQSKESGAKKCR